MPAKRKRKTRKKAKAGTGRNLREEMLIREMKFAIQNTERNRRFLRETLTRIKMPDIGRNVEIAWQTMERSFDLKDYKISLLLDALQEIEDQRRRASYAQTEMFDRSLWMHQQRLNLVGATFNRNIEEILNEKKSELKGVDYYQDTAENILHKIIWRVNRRDENASNMAKSIAIGKIDHFIEDGQNERRVIGAQYERRVEHLWNELRNVFADYRKSTTDRRKAYETIRKKDELDRREITNQWQRIAIFLEDISKFREKINSYKTDAAIEVQDVMRQADLFQAACRERSKRFVLDRQEGERKATIMSKEYNYTVKKFKKLIYKAERVLAYLQICRKYETQDEKIVQTINNYSRFQTEPIALQQTTALPLELALEDYNNSINFWRRLGLAELIVLELRVERDRLFTQAKNLQKSIACYLAEKEMAVS